MGTCKQPIRTERCGLRSAQGAILHLGADLMSAEEYAWLQSRAAAREKEKAEQEAEKKRQEAEQETARKAEKRRRWAHKKSSNGQTFRLNDWYCWVCGDLRFFQNGSVCRCGARDGTQHRGSKWFCRRCGERHDKLAAHCDICF